MSKSKGDREDASAAGDLDTAEVMGVVKASPPMDIIAASRETREDRAFIIVLTVKNDLLGAVAISLILFFCFDFL